MRYSVSFAVPLKGQDTHLSLLWMMVEMTMTGKSAEKTKTRRSGNSSSILFKFFMLWWPQTGKASSR
jgi:hypothetical protein